MIYLIHSEKFCLCFRHIVWIHSTRIKFETTVLAPFICTYNYYITTHTRLFQFCTSNNFNTWPFRLTEISPINNIIRANIAMCKFQRAFAVFRANTKIMTDNRKLRQRDKCWLAKIFTWKTTNFMRIFALSFICKSWRTPFAYKLNSDVCYTVSVELIYACFQFLSPTRFHCES